jgi:anti-anti-sigma factor
MRMNGKVNDFKELDDCVVIYTDNYLNDIEGEKLEGTCDVFLNSGKRKIVIDFANTELVNSIGISILVGIMDKVKEKNGIIFFSSLNKVNRDIFNMLGLTKYISIFQTEEEAIGKILVHENQALFYGK